MLNSRPIILRAAYPLLFALIGECCIAQGSAVPGMYLPPKGPCGADKLKECLRQGDMEAFKREEQRLIKECLGEEQPSPSATEVVQTPTSQPMVSAGEGSSERFSASGTTGSNCCERWVTTDPKGGGTWGYAPVGKDKNCTLADSPFSSIGIATLPDQIWGVCFVIDRIDASTFNIMTSSNAASTWCGTDPDNTGDYAFGMVLLSAADVKIALPGKAPKLLRGFKGSDFIDRLRKEENGQTSDFLAKVGMVFAYDQSADMITNPKADRCAVWSGNNYYGIASGGAVQPLVCLGGDGLSQPSLALADELHRTKSTTMQKVCDLFVRGNDNAIITGAFSGQPTPNPDITRPDQAWEGLLGECNGPNCTLICADGSWYGPTANFTNKAEWWGKVSSLNSPHLAMLAVVDPGAKVYKGIASDKVLVLTSQGDDVYLVSVKKSVVPLVQSTLGNGHEACSACVGLDLLKPTILNRIRETPPNWNSVLTALVSK